MTFDKLISYLKPTKKSTGKTFFDYSSKDKKRILKEAVEEGGKMQLDLIEKFDKSTSPEKVYCN